MATRTLAHAPARDAVAALTDAGVIDDRVLASVGVPTDDPSVLLAELVNNGAVTPFALLDVLGGGQPTDDETVEADVSGGSVIVAAHDG